jgi:glycerol-3-phosphate acyltransferase PlsY
MISPYLLVGVPLLSYLLGSIPFGYLLVRIFRGQDIRDTGSGNIGATNVARSGAKGLGALTLVLDTLKGAAAVYLAAMLVAPKYPWCQEGLLAFFCVNVLPFQAVAGLCAVLGHIFPVWLKFKGGKGVATALGVFVLLCPKAVLVSLAVFVVVVAATRYVSLGSVLSAISAPIAAFFLGTRDSYILLSVSAISLIIVIKHHANIGRLLAGTESRFGISKTPAEPPPQEKTS